MFLEHFTAVLDASLSPMKREDGHKKRAVQLRTTQLKLLFDFETIYINIFLLSFLKV